MTSQRLSLPTSTRFSSSSGRTPCGTESLRASKPPTVRPCLKCPPIFPIHPPRSASSTSRSAEPSPQQPLPPWPSTRASSTSSPLTAKPFFTSPPSTPPEAGGSNPPSRSARPAKSSKPRPSQPSPTFAPATFRQGAAALLSSPSSTNASFGRQVLVALQLSHPPPSLGTWLACQNLGGIANATLVDGDGEVCAFDSGPANMVPHVPLARSDAAGH
jgi:hypothetical protein